jgi:DNA adenine methylase
MTTLQSKVTKPSPFFKWAGGKQNLLTQYDRYFPEVITDYCEPFLGGGAVFFHLQSSNRIMGEPYLSDLNFKLITAYQDVRGKRELITLMSELDELQVNHSKENYYKIRKEYNSNPRSSKLIYLNKTGFNGLYRENKKGSFNTPIGTIKPVTKLYNRDNLVAISDSLQKAILSAISFDNALTIFMDRVLDRSLKDAFVFLDPPYNATWQGYTPEGFNNESEISLVKYCDQLTEYGIKFMLSNTDNDYIRNAFAKYHINEVSATRNISRDGNQRGKITELVITNY